MASTPLSRKDARGAAATQAPLATATADVDVDVDEKAAKKALMRAKIEPIARVIAIFVMPLIIVGMMITGYLGAMHNPQANDMPVVVSGTGEIVDDVADALADAEPTALAVDTADSDAEAREKVELRQAVAAVVIDDAQATLYTASAAGSAQVTLVTGFVTPVLLAQGLSVTATDLAPLPKNDPAGLAAVFLATALVMAGYMPFSVLRSNSPELLKFRRIVPLLAGWAAVIAAVVATVTGPIMDLVPGEHYLAVMGIAWLGVFAIGSVQTFFVRAFGPMGVIVGMFFLMVMGQPSSNMTSSMYTMPPFFRVLHEFLPMGAIGESMRSVLYFGATDLTRHLLVLAAGSLVGMLATTLWDRVFGRRHPEGVPTDLSIPSLHGGRRPKRKVWRYLSIAFFPFAMVTMMISTLLGAMHSPSPHAMPVAVVGSTIEQAEQTITGLEENMDDMFAFEAYALEDAEEVEQRVTDRDLVAGFVLPTQTSPNFLLVANEAGNKSAYQVVDRVFSQVAAAQQLPLEVQDVAPLPERDSNGVVVMYLAMGWILAGFMVVVVGANAAPATRPLKRMLPLTAVYAAMMSAFIWVIGSTFTGAIEGHFLELWGAGIVAIFSVAMFAMVFERLIGMLAIIPAIGILMFLGMPSSNAALSTYMIPDGFRTLHDLLPMPAAAETIRSILYFDGDVVSEHLQLLGLWGLVSLALVLIIDQLKPVRTEHDFGDDAPAPVPAAPAPAAKAAVAAPAEPAAEPATVTGELDAILDEGEHQTADSGEIAAVR